jgi:hypothetical protein
VALYDRMQAQQQHEHSSSRSPRVSPDPYTCNAALPALARVGRFDDGLAMLEQVLSGPQTAFVSSFPLALFLLQALRSSAAGAPEKVAARLVAMLEVSKKKNTDPYIHHTCSNDPMFVLQFLQAHGKRPNKPALQGPLALAFARGGDWGKALPFALASLPRYDSDAAVEPDPNPEAEADVEMQRLLLGALISLAAEAEGGTWPVALYLLDTLETAVPGGADARAYEAAAAAIRRASPDAFRLFAPELQARAAAAAAAAASAGGVAGPAAVVSPVNGAAAPATVVGFSSGAGSSLWTEEQEPMPRVSAGGGRR